LNKKLLLLFPNKANWATIATSIPILAGIAKKRNWEIDYFDTWQYEKNVDSNEEIKFYWWYLVYSSYLGVCISI